MFPAKEINYIPKYHPLNQTKKLNTWQSVARERRFICHINEIHNETSLIRKNNRSSGLKDTAKGIASDQISGAEENVSSGSNKNI